MKISRRHSLLGALYGAGAVGLRALATGLPVSFLLNPRKALAGPACPIAGKAQYVIFNTSSGGDPINASAPGTYADANIYHNPTQGTAQITMRGQSFTAGKPWGSLPQAVLDRMQFWHIMTNTPVHPKEREVLQLMGASPLNEQLPSLLAKAIAPCLNTLQAQPVALGPQPLAFNGQPLPLIPPNALKYTLASPTGPLAQLQNLRNQTMTDVYAFYKNSATPAQRAYVDEMITSQTQLKSIAQNLINNLSSITDNSPASQITAAITLFQMNLTPVVAIQIPFGGDNHSDVGLAKELAETSSGVATIASLMSQLQSVGLQDRVSFVSLNVFGRTLATNGGSGTNAKDGRNHNANHQVSLTIGKPFLGGVIGGVAPVQGDYGATAIQSTTGASSASGDIHPTSTLGAFGQTVLAAVGGDPTVITQGKVVTSALAP